MSGFAVLLELLIGGVVIGAVYSMVAISHSLIWSGVRVVNFAQSEVYMASAYIALSFIMYTSQVSLSVLVAIVLGVIAAILVGSGTFIFAIVPTRTKGFLYVVAVCLGISMLLQNISIVIWGASGYPFPPFLSTTPVNKLGLRIVPQDMLILGISLTAMILLFVFLKFTKVGTAMRASSENREVAGLMGINSKFTNTMTFVLGSALTGLAGVLMAPKFFVTPQMGSLIASKGFTAAVIGGFGNIPGAVIGGILLGVLENFAAGYISSQYKDAVAFLIMILIIIFFPGGIFESKTRRRV
jgi:branched-chain amino acid transport system permease protein